MRSAVAGKVYGSRHPSADKVMNWYRDGEFEKIMGALREAVDIAAGALV